MAIEFNPLTGKFDITQDPGGSQGQLQYYNDNNFAGVPNTSVDPATGDTTFSARWINARNSGLGAPASAMTGTWITGGTSETTKPHFLIEPSTVTTSNAWALAGTAWGINAPSGFTGNYVDFQLNGTSQFAMTAGASQITITSARTRINTLGVGINKLPQTGFDLDVNGISIFRSTVYYFGVNIETDTVTGTKIGTSTAQKIGFYNATPVAQGAAIPDATDLASAISSLNALLARTRAEGRIAT